MRVLIMILFQEISLQTGYFFTYNAGIINADEKKTININKLLLEEALDSILRRPELSYVLIDKNIVIYKRNEKPDRKDESKEPLKHTIICTSYLTLYYKKRSRFLE